MAFIFNLEKLNFICQYEEKVHGNNTEKLSGTKEENLDTDMSVM